MESTASNSNPSMTSEGTQNDQNDEIAQSKETYAQVKHFRFFNVASNFRGKETICTSVEVQTDFFRSNMITKDFGEDFN